MIQQSHSWTYIWRKPYVQKSLRDSPKCEQWLYLRGDIMGDLFLLPVSHLYFLTLVQLLSLSNEKHK